ncbi:hypothetical protein PybrP1_012881 [[Pythium] brassicae (nom. inval.)]|nr:hypothetical protein PybrP1_012881 [[Pythium] brassicae (nom. inval.)]
MVLDAKADADLALLRRLRARRSEKENAFESPKLRASAASASATASATRALTAGRSAEKERLALPASVNTQRASPTPAPPPGSAQRLSASAATGRIGLVPPVERTAQRLSERAPEAKKLQLEAVPHKPPQLALVPERIFECVLDDDGNVTTRCFIKGKFLGKGGFARCYEMTCEETGIKYAGKIVAKSTLAKPKAKQKFTSEIKIHKSLTHRQIVQFEHFFEDADNAYILLELCRNQSLSDLLRRRKKISEAEVRFYMRQITEDVKDTYKRIRANQFGFPDDSDVSESAQLLIRSILRGEPHLRPSLKAILAHPFLRDEFVPATLSRTALLITPPDCKRKVFLPERDRASSAEPLRSTHPLPLAPPRRHPLRSRDVNARASAGGSEQQAADENRAPAPNSNSSHSSSSHKPEAGRRDGATTPSSALRNSRATESTPTPALRRSEERQAAALDPLETIYATLARLFALEDGGGVDEPLSAHSSASSVVAAARRVREIRAETDARASAAPATLWVSQWVDYTSKYGLGYMLSNGSAGVYFNDSTKAVAAPDDAFFEYLERTSEAAHAAEQRVRYAAGEHDAALTKKVTLLKHFKSYLVDGRAEKEEADVLERQLARLGGREPAADASRPMAYVSKWVKTRHAMLFCLSNDTFQINFFDASKLLLSSGGRTVSYLDKEGVLAAFPTALVVLRNERPDLLKRLRYAKDMLQQMARTPGAGA